MRHCLYWRARWLRQNDSTRESPNLFEPEKPAPAIPHGLFRTRSAADADSTENSGGDESFSSVIHKAVLK
jgi:hypothetical protein